MFCDSLGYRDGDVELRGLMFRNSPDRALLLIHGGAGLDDHARAQAARWSTAGYTVFAADMYGPAIAGDRARIMESIAALSADGDALAGRAAAGLAVLRDQIGHDRIAVTGYCFGGMAALQLARSGANIRAAVSIHGSLKTSRAARPGLAARILVCHGALDPHVPLGDVQTLAAEMAAANADWQCNIYGGAEHGFTHANAVPGAIPGVSFNEGADRRSFDDADRFLDQCLP